MIAVFAWSIRGADRARVAESHWSNVLAAEPHIEAMNWQLSPEAREYLFSNAAAAVAAEPDNMHYRHWLCAYQWLSLTPYIDPNTGVLNAEALPWARQIVQDLHAARPLCPTFGATYCLAGEIEKFALTDPQGAGHIRTGYKLAPCDATTCLAAARCDAEESKTTEAFAKLARAVQLDGGLFARAVALCIDELGRADLAVALAGEDPARLAYVGNALTAAGKPVPPSLVAAGVSDPNDHSELAAQARGKAFEQLRIKCEAPNAPASAHASLAGHYSLQGDREAAIRQYRRALMKDYDQVGWHYALAQLLVQTNNVEDALREARICLRLRPDHGAAKKLIEQLSLPPQTAAGPLSSGE